MGLSSPGGAVAAALTPTLGEQHTLKTIPASGAAQSLDLADGNVFDVTLTGNCTFTFAGEVAGKGLEFDVLLRQDGTGGRTVTWPVEVAWAGGPAPVIGSAIGAITFLSFFSDDGGVTWIGFGPELKSRSISDLHVDVTATLAAETTLATLALPPTLAVGDIVEFEAWGDMLNNSGAGVTFQPKITIGATALTGAAVSIATNSARRQWEIKSRLLIVLPASDQRLRVRIDFSQAQAGWPINNEGAGNGYHGSGRLAVAENLPAGRNLVLSITLGTAAATIDFVFHEATLAVLKR